MGSDCSPMAALVFQTWVMFLASHAALAQNNTSQLLRGAVAEPAEGFTEKDYVEAILVGSMNINTTLRTETAGCQFSDAQVRPCGTKCFGKGGRRAQCMAECLGNTPCAQCYGTRGDCTISHCLGKCMHSSTSNDCMDCVDSHCRSRCCCVDRSCPDWYLPQCR